MDVQNLADGVYVSGYPANYFLEQLAALVVSTDSLSESFKLQCMEPIVVALRRLADGATQDLTLIYALSAIYQCAHSFLKT